MISSIGAKALKARVRLAKSLKARSLQPAACKPIVSSKTTDKKIGEMWARRTELTDTVVLERPKSHITGLCRRLCIVEGKCRPEF